MILLSGLKIQLLMVLFFSILIMIGCSKQLMDVEMFPVEDIKPIVKNDPVKEIVLPEIKTTPEKEIAEQAFAPIRETVYFDFDSYEVKDEYINSLNDISSNACHSSINIIGHTCEIGDADYNLRLGFKRAKSIENIIGKKCNIQLQSRGEKEPISENLKLNRRVYIEVK